MNQINPDVALNIRVALATRYGDVKTVKELTEMYDWIVAAVKPQSIVPVSKFEVVNNG